MIPMIVLPMYFILGFITLVVVLREHSRQLDRMTPAQQWEEIEGGLCFLGIPFVIVAWPLYAGLALAFWAWYRLLAPRRIQHVE